MRSRKDLLKRVSKLDPDLSEAFVDDIDYAIEERLRVLEREQEKRKGLT